MNIYKELRKERNLTQSDMAKLIHVDQSTISKWEQDKAVPDVQTLNVLAKFFDVSIDYLLGRSNISNSPSFENTLPQKENTVRIIGRGGVVKEYKVTEEQQKAFELLLASLPKDGIDPDVDF